MNSESQIGAVMDMFMTHKAELHKYHAIACSHKWTLKKKTIGTNNSRAEDSLRIVPWSVLNEIRSSLAAVRFLIYRVHDESNKDSNSTLQIASDELSRIESLLSGASKTDE